MQGVKQIAQCQYKRFDAQGLHIEVDGKPQTLDVDTVIGCIGQTSNDGYYKQAQEANSKVHVIGGAKLASEIDAKRAIKEALLLARDI